MKYRTDTGVVVTIPSDATDLEIYKACRKAELLHNQTHSALVYTVYEELITVERERDGKQLVTLDRVTECVKV